MKKTTTLLRRATSSLALITMLCASLLLPLSSKAASPVTAKTVAPLVSVEVCRINPLPAITCDTRGAPHDRQLVQVCKAQVPAGPQCQTFDMPQAILGSESQLELVYPDTSASPSGFEFSLSSRLAVDEKSPNVGVLRYVTHYSEDGQGTSIPRLSLSSSGKLELDADTVETLKFPKLTVTVKRSQ